MGFKMSYSFCPLSPLNLILILIFFFNLILILYLLSLLLLLYFYYYYYYFFFFGGGGIIFPSTEIQLNDDLRIIPSLYKRKYVSDDSLRCGGLVGHSIGSQYYNSLKTE